MKINDVKLKELDTKSDIPKNKSDNNRRVKPKKLTKAQKKKLMIEVLQNQLGIVTIACKQVGIHRDTHYTWMKEDAKYKKAAEDARFGLKDFGENALLKLVKEGNPSAIIYFNKTKNRDRGYGEHVKVEHSGNISTLTKEEREAEIKRLLEK